MKKQVKTMEGLRDSVLLFDKDVPPFGYMLLLVVLGIFFGTFFWSVNAHKPSVVIAKGTVTDTNASYVMPAYSGEIEACNMEEGALVQEGDVLFTIKSTDYNLQEEQLKSSRGVYEQQIRQAEKLVKSIKDDVNYFNESDPADALYYSTYETYKSQVEQNRFDGSPYAAYGYTQEQIQGEIEKNQAKIASVYYEAIRAAENQKSEAENQIASIDAQLAAVQNGQKAYTVTAASGGIVHKLADYKKGMVVQMGNAVATITPENRQPVIEAYISTADMARIQEQDKVQIVVDGLSQNLYGCISGTVQQIDSNLSSLEGKEGESSSVFKIRIQPDYDYVVSQSGKKVNITNGMTVEARIIYNEETYFLYVLDKLGLRIRK